jgi:hypothetical protein
MRTDRAFLVQLPTQLRFAYNALEKILGEEVAKIAQK